jgi:hypothetical protein
VSENRAPGRYCTEAIVSAVETNKEQQRLLDLIVCLILCMN